MHNGREKLSVATMGLRSLYLVLELSQEERQQVLYCVVLSQDGRKAHDDGGESRLHVLIGV